MTRRQKYLIFGIIGCIIISLLVTLYIYTKIPNFIFALVTFGIIFILTFTQVDYFVNKNERRQQFNIRLVFEILAILLLFGQISVLITQNKITSRQTQILEQTSQSIYPEVLLVSSQGYRTFKFDNILNNDKWKLAIGITNLGKAMIPSLEVNLEFDKKDEIRGGLEQRGFYKLKSLDYNFTWVRLTLYGPIEPTNFKMGERELKFRIDCPVCRKTVAYQSIPICIYNQTEDECENE